jgi:ectoine hydroxylase-related dioxygenase (phytanoyl-CoA dioxygenase family)
MNSASATLAEDGFCLHPGLLSDPETDGLLGLIEGAGCNPETRAGRRDVGESAALEEFLGAHRGIRSLVSGLLGDGAFPVRVLFFDKTPAANWLVAWHQDRTVAVAERRACAGFGGWSVKAGVPHVQPPAAVLEGMLTLRLHLDDCGPDRGPLRVLAGSHRLGLLDAPAMARLTASAPTVECVARRGDAFVMRPLLLHASSKARRPGRRRVLHIEYAAKDLPGGLLWRSRARGPRPTLPCP